MFDSDSSESENDSDDVSVSDGGDDRKMPMASIEEEADEEELGNAGGECQGDGLLGEQIAQGDGLVGEQIAQADPSSLFLHDDEDMGALMSFFADDSNYNNVEREPEVRIDNT